MQANKPQKTPKKTTVRGRPVGSMSKVTPKKIAYHTLRQNGLPDAVARDVTGYSNRSGYVDQSGTIDQQREKALKALDLTIHSQFKTLIDIRDDTQRSCPSDRIHAVKTINSMVPGFTAPAEVKINSTAIIAEFRDMSSGDLANLAHMLNVNVGVPNRCTVDVEDVQVVDSNSGNICEQLISNPLDNEGDDHE